MSYPSRNRRHVLSLTIALALGAGMSTSTWAHTYDNDGYRSGMVFTSSNASSGNELLAYSRNQDGLLTLSTRVSTGGLGSNAGLGSQGAVSLSSDGRYVFVVNAQSNTISTFRIHEHSLQLTSVVPSGGLHPISVTEYDEIVYVLNDGGAGNVAGFKNQRGELKPIEGSSRGLSVASGAGPAQVGFSSDGDTLIVTEKATNKLTSYRVADNGRIGSPLITPSAGQTPFGFAFNRRNKLIVSEAAGGATGASTVSSYRFNDKASSQPIVASAAVPDTQSAACWVAITPNGRYAYIANAGSASVSSYRIAHNGQIELINARAGQTGTGSAPIDEAISLDGSHLYVLSARNQSIASFNIDHEGNLLAQPVLTGLPATAVGVAAN
ncbi:lactonase family protein [Ampullimonas aquatilis]|uniref:lactonase family protein n=1 Tax=Ampullimonas aquatilis TaxID=1341549 RepID=UPI003C745047